MLVGERVQVRSGRWSGYLGTCMPDGKVRVDVGDGWVDVSGVAVGKPRLGCVYHFEDCEKEEMDCD